MSRIFISHSSKDSESAKLPGEWLEKQGHTSYFLGVDSDKGIAAGKPVFGAKVAPWVWRAASLGPRESVR